MNWDNIPLQRHLELNRLCKQLLLTYSKSWFEIDLKICKQFFSAFLQKNQIAEIKTYILIGHLFQYKKNKNRFYNKFVYIYSISNQRLIWICGVSNWHGFFIHITEFLLFQLWSSKFLLSTFDRLIIMMRYDAK